MQVIRQLLEMNHVARTSSTESQPSFENPLSLNEMLFLSTIPANERKQECVESVLIMEYVRRIDVSVLVVGR